jgi:hypothetical protein
MAGPHHAARVFANPALRETIRNYTMIGDRVAAAVAAIAVLSGTTLYKVGLRLPVVSGSLTGG